MSYVRRACNIGSVSHDSVVRGCVLLSASSSLIYHFWFLKHHHSAATHHHHPRWWRSCRSHKNCMHAEQIIIIFYILFFNFCSMYLLLFSIVLYRTIVTVYTNNIFLYNYLRQMHQIIMSWSHFPWWSTHIPSNWVMVNEYYSYFTGGVFYSSLS